MCKKSNATSERRWSNAQLDFELRRRQHCPPDSVRRYPDQACEQWISVNELRVELDATPADHPERSWREWELALAERQVARWPDRPRFYRVVDRPDHNDVHAH